MLYDGQGPIFKEFQIGPWASFSVPKCNVLIIRPYSTLEA